MMRALIICIAFVLLSIASADHSHHKHRVLTQEDEEQRAIFVEKMDEIDELLLQVMTPKKPETSADGVCTTAECQLSADQILANMDMNADPCDNFFDYACGTYYVNNPPINGASQGTFYTVDDILTAALDDIFNADDKPTDPQIVQDTRAQYRTCEDTETTDSLGLEPLWRHLNMHGQEGWPIAMNPEDFNETAFTFYPSLVHVQTTGVAPFIGIGISTDFFNTSYMIMYIAEGGVGLSSTYLLNPDEYPDQIAYYTTYIAETAKLIRDYINSDVSDRQIENEAADIVAFEIEIANTFQWIPTNKQDILERMDVEYLQNITDSGTPDVFNWVEYFEAMYADTDVVIDSSEPVYIYGEKYFDQFSNLLATASNRDLSNYLGWRFVLETNRATTYAMRNVSLDYQNSMDGLNRTSFGDIDSHCRIQTEYNMPMPTTRAYADDYFKDEAKQEVKLLVEFIRSAFNELLMNNTWMDPDDLISAEVKLAAIADRVAYPDWVHDNAYITLVFQGLDLVEGQQFDNLMKTATYNEYWIKESFRSKPDDPWLMPSTEVNAYYFPSSNSITILIGIIENPFYVQNSLAAVNYGAIGMVIGHEFTHGFDDSGRHYDKDGNRANWWSQDSIDGFNNRSQCFVDQYDQYSPPEFVGTIYENVTVDGQFTLGENIADNGGIREAFTAYASYVDQFGAESALPGLEDYTSEQLFYLGFAGVWCEHKTASALNSQINNDVHSPGQFRIIGPLSNDANFWNTWNCRRGDAMNRGQDACILW